MFNLLGCWSGILKERWKSGGIYCFGGFNFLSSSSFVCIYEAPQIACNVDFRILPSSQCKLKLDAIYITLIGLNLNSLSNLGYKISTSIGEVGSLLRASSIQHDKLFKRVYYFHMIVMELEFGITIVESVLKKHIE